MDIRVLKYFVAAAQSGSISAASKALYITQPTLTRQFKELEDELGEELMIRSKNGITLTEKGELFYERAQEVLSLVDRLSAEIKRQDELQGTLTIAAAEAGSIHLLATALHSFCSLYPKVKFEVITATRTDALSMLDKNGFDFALLVRSADTRDYSVLSLNHPSRWGIVALKDSPVGRMEKIKNTDLKKLPLILPSSEFSDRSFEGWLGYPLNELNIRGAHNLINNGCALVEAGLGYLVTMDGILERLPKALTFVPLSPRLTAPALLAWKKGRTLSKIAQLFLEEVNEQIAGNHED